ncbi:hypothetical protein VTJ04DRAFT_2704 [Mycothermus thermophilus]|uniref:uncharacterized protein n=1 Tax=Humicola insolens TaxID=85995 RepID=UPI0037447178
MLRQQASSSASFATTDAQHSVPVEQHHNPSRSSYATVSTLSTTRSPTGNSWSTVSPQSSMSSAPVVAPTAPFISSQEGPVFAQAITDSPRLEGEGGNNEVPPLNLNNTSQHSAWSSMTTPAELEGSGVNKDVAMHAVAGAGAWTTEAAELEGTSPTTDNAMLPQGYSGLPPNHISELPGEFGSRGSTFIGTSQAGWMMAMNQSPASLPSSQSMFPQSRNPRQELRRQFSFDSTPDIINVRRYGVHDNQAGLANAHSTYQDMWQQHTSSCPAPERRVSSSATSLLDAQASHPSRNDSPVENGFQFPSDARSQLPSQQRASPRASAPSADAWWLAPDVRGLEFEDGVPRGCRPCNKFPDTGSQAEKLRKIRKHLNTDRHRANVGLSRVEKTHCPVPNCRAVRNRGDNWLHHLRNKHPEFVEQHPEYRAQRPAQRRRRASTSFLIGR